MYYFVHASQNVNWVGETKKQSIWELFHAVVELNNGKLVSDGGMSEYWPEERNHLVVFIDVMEAHCYM